MGAEGEIVRLTEERADVWDEGHGEGYAAGVGAATAELEKVIADLDRARANGTLYTYGQIQVRLRHAIATLSTPHQEPTQ